MPSDPTTRGRSGTGSSAATLAFVPGGEAPTPWTFAVVVAVGVASLWLNVGLAADMQAVDKDFGLLFASVRAFVNGQGMYTARLAPNLNPPHFHLLLLPLTGLTPRAAWPAWCAAGLASLTLSTELVRREIAATWSRWHLWVGGVALLSWAPMSAVVATGQVSWFLMLPLTLAWIAARGGRWKTAGLYLGIATSLKLFLLLFVPYLIIRRKPGALVAGCASGAACFAIGLLVFGAAPYRAWLEGLRHVSWSYVPMNASVLGALTRVLSITGPIRDGDPAHYAPLVHMAGLVTPLTVVAAVAIATCTLWAARGGATASDTDRQFGLVVLGALLISPLGWIYYLWLALGPVLGVVLGRPAVGARARQLLVGGIAALFVPLPATMLSQPFGVATATIGSVYFWGVLAIWVGLWFSRGTL